MKNSQKIFIILIDILLIVASFYLAFYLRYEGNIPPDKYSFMLKILPNIILLRILCFMFFGIYNELKRYVGLKTIVEIFYAICVSSLIFVVLIFFIHDSKLFPKTIFFIDSILLFILLSVSRFFNRIVDTFAIKKIEKRILIVGAGDAANKILREIRLKESKTSEVIGFIDDDTSKLHMKIDGIHVLGNRYDIKKIAESKKINEIIIAIANINTHQLRELLNECEKTKATFKIIPMLKNIDADTLYLEQVKTINIEDLLGRAPYNINPAMINNYLKGKRILVTGAGGSIGSEICRQLLKFEISALVLFGRGEHSIYEIHREIQGGFSTQTDFKKTYRVLGDIINKKKLEIVFERFNPDIVFHAAADKHVELMELNPDEAVFNNVIGTKNLIDTCDKFKVEKLICISTDKAANPKNVMGYSKRLAELYIQNKKTLHTKVMAVRFGNVLGSRGSVIPLFQKQIAKREAITITHPDVDRYFMTIPEAAQLVIEVGGLGDNGEIFLLDMGTPVKIVDLAKDMIKLAGLQPDIDIKIKYIGLKQGEKLTEVLTNTNEQLSNTSNPKIYKVNNLLEVPVYDDSHVVELKQLAIEMNNSELMKKVKKMVDYNE